MEILKRVQKMSGVAANAIVVGAHEEEDAVTDFATSHFDRIRSLTHLARNFTPSLIGRLADTVIKPEMLPFKALSVNYVASGGKQDVFKVETTSGRFALKIDRRSIGMQSKELEQRAQKLKLDYEDNLSSFTHINDFILPEEFVVLQGPVLGIPAIGIIQPFIDKSARGIFEDYSQEQLLSLLEKNPSLKRKFTAMVETVTGTFNQGDRGINILGTRNLSILDEARMIFYDPHDVIDLKTTPRMRRTIILDRLDYLSGITRSLI